MPILPTLFIVSQLFGGIFAGYRDASDFGFEPGLVVQGLAGYESSTVELLLRAQYGDEPKTYAGEGWTDMADFRLRIHAISGLFGTVGAETTAWHVGEDTKRAFRPLLGLGFDAKSMAVEVLYRAADRTENELEGWSLEVAGPVAPKVAYQVLLFSGRFTQDGERQDGLSYRLLIGYMFEIRPRDVLDRHR